MVTLLNTFLIYRPCISKRLSLHSILFRFPLEGVGVVRRYGESFPWRSTISEHAHNTGHHPLWNEVKSIDRDLHCYTRRVKEVIHIRLHPNNIKSGIHINSRSMDAHDQETQQQESCTIIRTAEGTTHQNSED